jgi:hypothetical protein
VHSCTHWLRPPQLSPSLPPRLGSYTRARLLVSQDRRHLFVIPILIGPGRRPLYWKNCTVLTFVLMFVAGSGERSGSAGGGGEGRGGGGGGKGGPGNPGRGRSKQTRAEREYTPTCLPARTGPQLVRTCPGARGGGGFDIRGDKNLFVSNPPSSPHLRRVSKKLVMKYLAHSLL